MKAIYKKFSVDLYGRGVLVFFGGKEELYRVAKGIMNESLRQDVESVNFQYTEAICIRTNTDAIIYAPHRPYDETILHELGHAVFHILRKVDIDPTASEEAYTYLFEYLFRKVFHWLNALDGVHKQ